MIVSAIRFMHVVSLTHRKLVISVHLYNILSHLLKLGVVALSVEVLLGMQVVSR